MITEAQRRERQSGIGGSDAAAILGVSPYTSAVDLWLEKTGQVEPANLDDVEPVQWGNVLEEPVAREFARRSGLRLARVNRTLRHPKHPFMVGHMDRRVIGRPHLVEIKTVRALEDDAPRPDHVAQVRHYMAVTGLEAAHLVYLIAGQRLVSHTVERDAEAEAALIRAEAEFWERVTTRTPPLPVSIADLRALHPVDSGVTVTASVEIAATVERLAEITARRKALEAEEREAQSAIMAAMGDASELRSTEGRPLVTWKATKPAQVLDRARLEADHPDLVAAYLAERAGARRFVLKGGGA